MSSPKNSNSTACPFCGKPYKRMSSYHKHVRKCREQSNHKINVSNRDDNSPRKRKTKKFKQSFQEIREELEKNRKATQKIQEEYNELRKKNNDMRQELSLLSLSFDKQRSSHNELLQMIENFAISFLKTREYEF